MPDYYIVKHPFETNNIQEISEAKWNDIKKYKAIESNTVSIEQKYDLLLNNYFEFEKHLLESALRYSFHLTNDSQSSRHRLTIARVTINLLMSIGLYEEQLRQRHINRIALDETQSKLFMNGINELCTTNTDYRFIKELRNYVAHNDLPLDTITFSLNREKIEKEDQEKKGIHVIPTIGIEKLRRDKHFKNSKLKNIAEVNGKIDLRLYIRKVISKLSAIQKNLRMDSGDNLKLAEGYIKDTINNYNKAFQNSSKYCYAIKENHKSESIFLSYSRFERITEFRELNLSHVNLETGYIHNRIK